MSELKHKYLADYNNEELLMKLKKCLSKTIFRKINALIRFFFSNLAFSMIVKYLWWSLMSLDHDELSNKSN